MTLPPGEVNSEPPEVWLGAGVGRGAGDVGSVPAGDVGCEPAGGVTGGLTVTEGCM